MSAQETKSDVVELAVEDGIATLALNRPQALNALNAELVRALRETLRQARSRDDIRVLILTGRGRAFCAGADLRDPMVNPDLPPAERGRRFLACMDQEMNALIRELYAFDRPKIAAINGPAVGGGTSLALLADIAFAARSAWFAQTFTPALGLIPDLGGAWQLVRRLGRARALGLSMLGEQLTAETAAEWGLIWRCVDDDQLMPEVLHAARKLRDGPPLALSLVPRALDQVYAHDFSGWLDIERDLQRALIESADFAEGVAAFRQKRQPRFRGG